MFCLLVSFSLSVSICICENVTDCAKFTDGLCEPDAILNPNDPYSSTFYEELARLISREKVVDLCFIRFNYYLNTYVPIFSIEPFQDKNISLKAGRNNFEPLRVNLTYSENVDFRQIYIKSDIDLTLVGDSDDIELEMNELVFEGKAKLSIDPKPKKATLIFRKEEGELSKFADFNFIEIVPKKFKAKIGYTTYTLNFTQDGIVYNEAGYGLSMLKIQQDAEIEFAAGSSYDDPFFNLIATDLTDYTKCPTISFSYIMRYTFIGNWPQNPPSFFSTFGSPKYNILKLDFDIPNGIMPFNFIAQQIQIKTLKNINFIGSLTISEEGSYNRCIHFGTNVTKVLTVNLANITTNYVYYDSSNFEVKIDKCTINSQPDSDGKFEFPIQTIITRTGISKTTVKSITYPKGFSPASLYIWPEIPDDVSEDELHNVFDNFGYFLDIPLSDWNENSKLPIKYAHYGGKRPGFKDDDNWLGYETEIDKTTNSVKFTFVWEIDPYDIPVKELVYGERSIFPERLGPNLNLLDLITMHPSTRIFELTFIPDEGNAFQVFSTIDLPRDQYQFTFKYDDYDDKGVVVSFDLSNITKTKFKFFSIGRFHIKGKLDISAKKIHLSETVFDSTESLTLDTEYLEIDPDTLVLIPRQKLNQVKKYDIILGSTLNGITVHQETIQIGNGAIIPFDSLHKITFLASNNFNINCDETQFDKFYGFNINITLQYLAQSISVLIGNFPNITQILNPIVFNHNSEASLSITYSILTDRNIFTVLGDGPTVINNDYGDLSTICTCNQSNCEIFDSTTCSSSNSVLFNQLSSLILSINDKLNYNIMVFGADEENFPIFKVSAFNLRSIRILLGKGQSNYTLGFDNSEKMENPSSSLIDILGCKSLKVVNAGDLKLELGTLVIQGYVVEFEDFENIDFTTTYLKISPSMLSSFNSLTIRKTLDLTPFASVAETDWTGNIFFTNDFTGTRLTITYGNFERDITLGEETMKIGDNLIFHIPKQNSYSVSFILSSVKSNIKNEANDITKIPRFSIDGGSADSVNIIFKGNWPETDEPMISLSAKKSMEVSLSGIVPLKVNFIGDKVKFIATSLIVGIWAMEFHTESGDYDKKSYIIEMDSTISDKSVSFIFEDVFSLDTLLEKGSWSVKTKDTIIEMKYYSSTIQTSFKGFSLINIAEDPEDPEPADPDDDGAIILKIRIEMTPYFINTLTIEQNIYPITLENMIFEATIKKGVDYDKMPLINNEFLPFIIAPEEVLKTYDLTNLVFENKAEPENQAYGFITHDNVVGFRYSTITPSTMNPSYQIYMKQSLYDKPFIAQIIDQSSTKLENVAAYINGPDYSGQLASAIIPKIKELIVYVTINMNKKLDLTLLDSKLTQRTNIVIDGKALSKHDASIAVGSKVLELEISNINLINLESAGLLSSTTTAPIDLLILSNTIIQKGALIINNNVKKLRSTITSYASLIEKSQLAEYSNEITLIKSNLITFTEGGWKVQEYYGMTLLEITKKDATDKKLSLECLNDVKMTISEPRKMSQINIIPISLVDPTTFTLGDGWNFITNAKDLKIHIDTNIDLYSSSYPIQNIFDSDNFTFNFDDMSFNIDVELYDNYKINESVLFDLTPLAAEKQSMIGHNVIFENVSSLSFVDNKGYLDAENIIVKNNSRSSISASSFKSYLDIVEDAQLSIGLKQPAGIFNISWNYANFPSITLTEAMTRRSIVRINYNGLPSIDNATYNLILKNLNKDLIIGDFDCLSWIEKVEFVSSIPDFSNDPEIGIFNLSCSTRVNNMMAMTIKVVKELPIDDGGGGDDDDDDDGSDSDNTPIPVGGIVGIALSCFAVAAIVTGLVVYFCTRHKYEKLQGNSSIDSTEIRAAQEEAQKETTYIA